MCDLSKLKTGDIVLLRCGGIVKVGHIRAADNSYEVELLNTNVFSKTLPNSNRFIMGYFTPNGIWERGRPHKDVYTSAIDIVSILDKTKFPIHNATEE